jgi:hypothetical protein
MIYTYTLTQLFSLMLGWIIGTFICQWFVSRDAEEYVNNCLNYLVLFAIMLILVFINSKPLGQVQTEMKTEKIRVEVPYTE